MPVDPQHDKGREALERLAADLEGRLRRLSKLVIGLTALCMTGLACGIGIYTGWLEIPAQLSPDEVIKVRGMVVVDGHGTPRLQIGSPLPDPPILGKRINRESTAHGILLFDSEGNERGSFVTIDESGAIMLSLDEIARMVARFYAYPAGGARLVMTDRNQNRVELGTFTDGPYLELARPGDELLLQPGRKKEQP